QRFAVVPRDPRDVQLGAAAPSSGPSAAPSGRAGPTLAPWQTEPPGVPFGSDDPLASGEQGSVAGQGTGAGEPGNANVSDLPELLGRRVRIGGQIATPDADGFTLVDTTGQVTVRMLHAGALTPVGLSDNDVVNVVGWDAERAGGDLEIVVEAA